MERAKLYKSIWVNKIKLYCFPKSSDNRNLNNTAAFMTSKILTQLWPGGISSPGKMALQGWSVLKYQGVKPCKVNYFSTLYSLPGRFRCELVLMDKALTLKLADLSLCSVTSFYKLATFSELVSTSWKWLKKTLLGFVRTWSSKYKRPCLVLGM